MGVLCSLVSLSPHPPQALSPCQMRAVALRVSARPQAHLCWCRRRLAGPVMGPGGPWGAPGTLAGLPTPVVGPVSRGGQQGGAGSLITGPGPRCMYHMDSRWPKDRPGCPWQTRDGHLQDKWRAQGPCWARWVMGRGSSVPFEPKRLTSQGRVPARRVTVWSLGVHSLIPFPDRYLQHWKSQGPAPHSPGLLSAFHSSLQGLPAAQGWLGRASS